MEQAPCLHGACFLLKRETENKKASRRLALEGGTGRGERIRTSGLYVPNNEYFEIQPADKGFLVFVLQLVLHCPVIENKRISFERQCYVG